jgi:hypothetical protein
MSAQENQNVPYETILKSFLKNINTHNLYNFSHNSTVLAIRFRNGKRATGRSILEKFVYQEARRLQIIQSHYIIILATKRIWLSSTRFQRQKFIDLANKINDLNNRRQIADVNANTIKRINQINFQEVTNTSFENDFYNGAQAQFDTVDILEFPGSPFP